MQNFIRFHYVLLFILIVTIFTSCEKGDDGFDDLPASGNKAMTNLSGSITDESGNPMAGVKVKADNNTTYTNAFGIYIFENINVNSSRFVIVAKQPGYYDAVKGVQFIKGKGSHFGNLQMLKKELSGTILSQNGGNVTLSNGSGITFPPNAFVDENGLAYTGNVQVYALHINHDTPDFLSKIPGGDLRAVNDEGTEKMLQTFGMMKTDLVGSAGQKLNLAPGKKATLNFAIASSQQSQGAANIPLWYLDEKTALWHQEGIAVRNGNIYQGEVSHFTWWNCDIPASMVDISGIVIDCMGNPMANITISFNGIYTLTTNSLGQYSAMWPENVILTAQVFASMNTGIAGNSNIIQGGPFTTSPNVLPDLVVPCNTSRLTGFLKDCNGNAVSGYVVITGTQQPTSQYCPNGVINIHVLPGLPVNLIAYAGTQSGTSSAVAGPQGTSVNIGSLTVCDVNQQSNIVLNGDAFNNQTFNIDTTSTNSLYSPSGPSIGIIITGYTIPSNKQVVLQIDFCGNGTGIYPLGPTPTCNSDISMILDGVSYYPDDTNSTNDFISVVEFGEIGSMIKGTFFTHLARIDPIVGAIPITMSGTFMVPRRQ